MKKRKRIILILILFVVIIAAIVATVFLLGKNENIKPAGTNSVESQETEVSVYYDGDTCIQTEYITLHMPEQWSDCLRVVQRKMDDSLEYDFYCNIPGKEEMKLFAINFNNAGEYHYGKITTENGEDIHISLTAADLAFDDDWSAEEIDEVCAMQESSNYLMEQLRKEKIFSEN